MRLGFSTLALFMEPLENILQKAEDDGFELVELLCEGPYWPRRLLQDGDSLEVFESFDLEVLIHAPTIDLNPASMNRGIREETGRQMVETIDRKSVV